MKRKYVHYIVITKDFFSTKRKYFVSKLQAENYANRQRKELFGWIKSVSIRKKK